jgi:hypothetical protein
MRFNMISLHNTLFRDAMMVRDSKSAFETRSQGHFSLKNLVVIALLAALGLVVKPLLNPLSRFMLSTFLIPGGVLFGGLYMMWLVLARGMVGKTGSATLAAFIQGVLASALGLSPLGGLVSILIYLLPGMAIDLIFLIPGRGKICRLSRYILSCMVANLTGIILVALLRGIVHGPLLLLMTVGAASGCVGGLAAYAVAGKIPLKAPLHTGQKKAG